MGCSKNKKRTKIAVDGMLIVAYGCTSQAVGCSKNKKKRTKIAVCQFPYGWAGPF